MTTLLLVEHAGGAVKDASVKALTAAKQLGAPRIPPTGAGAHRPGLPAPGAERRRTSLSESTSATLRSCTLIRHGHAAHAAGHQP